VNVSLSWSPEGLLLTVADDGRGITRKALQDPASLGLLGMRERASAFGGTVEIRHRRGKGTVVNVAIPPARRFPRAKKK
jgi:signal transduction histidine kinase